MGQLNQINKNETNIWFVDMLASEQQINVLMDSVSVCLCVCVCGGGGGLTCLYLHLHWVTASTQSCFSFIPLNAVCFSVAALFTCISWFYVFMIKYYKFNCCLIFVFVIIGVLGYFQYCFVPSFLTYICSFLPVRPSCF